MTLVEFLGVLGALVTVILGLAAIAALVARLVLLPWLKVHLVEPIAATATEALEKWTLAAYMYEHHITRCSEEWPRLWAEIEKLRQEKKP